MKWMTRTDDGPSARETRGLRQSSCWMVGIALLVAAGCGPTSVETTSQVSGRLPRPNVILVYDFAVTPEEVQLDEGISTQILQQIQQSQGTSRTAQEIKVGHAVANAVAAELVTQIRGYGLPGQRALGWPARQGNTLMVKGQLRPSTRAIAPNVC